LKLLGKRFGEVCKLARLFDRRDLSVAHEYIAQRIHAARWIDYSAARYQ